MRGAKGFSCAGVAGLCPSTVCEYVGFGAHQTELGIDSVRRGAFGSRVASCGSRGDVAHFAQIIVKCPSSHWGIMHALTDW